MQCKLARFCLDGFQLWCDLESIFLIHSERVRIGSPSHIIFIFILSFASIKKTMGVMCVRVGRKEPVWITGEKEEVAKEALGGISKRSGAQGARNELVDRQVPRW
jgi:hypothetical protein